MRPLLLRILVGPLAEWRLLRLAERWRRWALERVVARGSEAAAQALLPRCRRVLAAGKVAESQARLAERQAAGAARQAAKAAARATAKQKRQAKGKGRSAEKARAALEAAQERAAERRQQRLDEARQAKKAKLQATTATEKQALRRRRKAKAELRAWCEQLRAERRRAAARQADAEAAQARSALGCAGPGSCKVRVRPAWSAGEHWVPGDVRARSCVEFEEQPTLQQRVGASKRKAQQPGHRADVAIGAYVHIASAGKKRKYDLLRITNGLAETAAASFAAKFAAHRQKRLRGGLKGPLGPRAPTGKRGRDGTGGGGGQPAAKRILRPGRRPRFAPVFV